MRRCCAVAVLVWSVSACGGSSGGGSPSPPGGGTGTGSSQNPCPTSSLTAERPPSLLTAERRADKKRAIDGDPRYRVFDALSLHREAAQWRLRRGVPEAPAADSRPAGREAIDIGDIAVVPDEGDLIAPANPYDLRGLGLRFSRNGAGGYDVLRIPVGFRTALGRQLTLEDDDSEEAPLASGFSFTFFSTAQTHAFVNSDGNLTFEAPDFASTERNVARLTTGPPRVAPFLADLDPSAGGRVFVNAASDQYVVTWCNVRGFESTRTVSAQAVLLPDGSIEMHFVDAITLTDAVVGISPGRTGEFRPLDLSASGTSGGGSSSVGERFAAVPLIDTVAVSKKFYASHPDDYDQLVIWTDARLIQDAFAFEQTVANEIQGIGLPVFDASRDFGSGGRLRSMAMMDFLGKYPEDPLQKFFGENNTVSVMGQEVGHRWLAFLDFRDHTGTRSQALLGRDDSHWSFFFDSDASVMEGNDIEELGGGAFRTVGAVSRFSLLDQYAMGLVAPGDVPPFFYVQNPVNVVPSRTAASAPQIGVTFSGIKREVRIDDVIAVLGPRIPAAADSPREHRQAFIYVTSAGRPAEASQVEKVDRIRRAWEEFFAQATNNRMRAVTTLR